jgi:hypothetical protein
MLESVKILKNLSGKFVSAEEVKQATQKDYNQYEWNKTVDGYLMAQEVRFFKTKGSIYDFDYYVIYLVDGIRFLQEVSYSSSLTSGGFAYGFFTMGLDDEEACKKVVEKFPELAGIEHDKLTILSHNDGRIATHAKARAWMREESAKLPTCFFTKKF